MVAAVDDAIHQRVAHVHVGRGHVYLGAQDALAVGELAALHALEELEVLGHRAVAVGALLPGHGGAAFLGGYLLGRLVVDVGLAVFDELDGPFVELLKIVRGISWFAHPVEAEPVHIFHYRIDIFDIFLDGVGVVEAQVAAAVEVARYAEVEAYRLGVAYVQVSVGFGRKAGQDFPVVLVLCQVGFYLLIDEVGLQFGVVQLLVLGVHIFFHSLFSESKINGF